MQSSSLHATTLPNNTPSTYHDHFIYHRFLVHIVICIPALCCRNYRKKTRLYHPQKPRRLRQQQPKRVDGKTIRAFFSRECRAKQHVWSVTVFLCRRHHRALPKRQPNVDRHIGCVMVATAGALYCLLYKRLGKHPQHCVVCRACNQHCYLVIGCLNTRPLS